MSYTKKQLPLKSAGLSDWYNRVVLLAELADYGPAKGTMIFRPYGYALWEKVQEELGREIKKMGADNAYFPLFIPESLIKKEKSHVKGFSPELAVVTIGGGEELDEKLIVRPTSETIMYEAFSRWVQSWRDLPLKINQWNNVVRWEKRTYLFLRTSEFLWQEGHTAHATEAEAISMMEQAMQAYAKIYHELFALPGYVGRKSESEKFAGAVSTLSYESLMPEGKALQSCTSHNLGQNFSKPFDVTFQNTKGQMEHVWQTSWGFSTRSLGGLIMSHGDDSGLRLPPAIAPIQVIVLPVRSEQAPAAQEIVDRLQTAGIRAQVDADDSQSLGSKINRWELKGVPLRVEVGENEIKAGRFKAVRRDNFESLELANEGLEAEVGEALDKIQQSLWQQACDFLEQNTREATDYEQFKSIMKQDKGFIKAWWCEQPECEATIKQQTTATVRCLPQDAPDEPGKCVHCSMPAKARWLFAQSY